MTQKEINLFYPTSCSFIKVDFVYHLFAAPAVILSFGNNQNQFAAIKPTKVTKLPAMPLQLRYEQH